MTTIKRLIGYLGLYLWKVFLVITILGWDPVEPELTFFMIFFVCFPLLIPHYLFLKNKACRRWAFGDGENDSDDDPGE